MKKSIYLLLFLPLLSFGQIKVIEFSTAETIGKIAPMGQTLVECSKNGNTYTFVYKDVKYTSLNEYEFFSFNDIDNAYNSLFDTIMKGLKEKRRDNICS